MINNKAVHDVYLAPEQEEHLRKGAVYTSLAYMLMDCADSCMMFAQDRLDKVDCYLPLERRVHLQMAKKSVKEARSVVTSVTEALYNCGESDKLIDDADWLLECIIEIIARTNNNDYARQDMLEYIKKKVKTVKTRR